MLSQSQISNLDRVAVEFECPLLFPPAKEIENPFFDITQLWKNNSFIFEDFLNQVKAVGDVTYDSIPIGEKLFLEVRDV